MQRRAFGAGEKLCFSCEPRFGERVPPLGFPSRLPSRYFRENPSEATASMFHGKAAAMQGGFFIPHGEGIPSSVRAVKTHLRNEKVRF